MGFLLMQFGDVCMYDKTKARLKRRKSVQFACIYLHFWLIDFKT